MDVLIDASTIAGRLAALGGEINEYYAGGPVTVIVLLNGAMIFAADLVRHLKGSVHLDSLAVASYSGTARCGELAFRSALKLPVKDRHILLIDDILDSGCTLAKVREYLLGEGACEVKVCVMLDKQVKRAEGGLASADWTGFQVPNRFIVGYGLDAAEEYRHFADICALD